ncbi:MAG: hypothetical protein K6F54_05770 [Lachnospiraceae bacterium]|nr:hypothetical protein [Lachnospiraceae bacterium]
MNKDKARTSKVNKDKKPVRPWKRVLSIVVAVAIAAGGLTVFFNRSLIAEALFNPDEAIIYSTFKTSTTVEDSVLFIGTYIVHKDALTDKIYEDAMASASDSGQNSIYYKSELSDGQWFDVGDVDNGIKGISSEGTPVPEENIDPLYVTYYAGSDGILRDAKTLAGINPFDIPDPYDLSKLPELQSLWLQYTYSETAESISQEDFLKNRNSADSGNLRSDVYYYQLLSTFFSLDLRDEETNKLDEQLNGLNNLYISLKAAGSDDEAELVYHLMDMVDSKRRALVMERLSELDTNLLNTLYTLATGSYYTPYGNFKDSSVETETGETYDYITELQDSLQHDFTASQSPLLQYPWIQSWFSRLGIVTGGNGWWTVLDTAQSDRRKRAEEANAENDDWVYDETPLEMSFSADTSLLDAIGSAMSDCGDSYTKYMAKCLDDKDDVLGHAEYEYAVQVIDASGGGSLGGPVTYLKHVIKIKDNNVADAAGELDMLKSTLIGTCSSRYTSKAASGVNADYYSLSSVNARSTSLEDQKADLEAERSMLQFLIDGVRMRDTAANALAFVYERIDWTEALKGQIADDDFKTYATSSVEAHLVWLREEAQRIIDSDESLKSDADRLRDKKADLQAKRDGALDNNDLAGAAAYDAMIAAVDNDLNSAGGGAGSSDNMADQLLDKAMDKLADNANADLSGIADALAGMGADDALKDLAEKAAASGASADTLKGINDAMNAAGAGAGSGSISADELLAQLEALFGKSLDEMDDRELAITCATLSQLAKSGISPAEELLAQLISRLLNGNNSYLYTQYGSSKTVEYVNMRTLSLVTSYRYFYDETKATATLTNGAKVYIFKRGSSNMYNGSEESEPEQLTDPAVYQGEIMVGEEDTMRYFKCTAEYLKNSEYSLCLTSTMQSIIAGYVETLSEMFAAS